MPFEGLYTVPGPQLNQYTFKKYRFLGQQVIDQFATTKALLTVQPLGLATHW